jgi:hypothetical protein
MANINLTFNETTYNFNYCLGQGEDLQTYEYYKIYINGELDSTHILEQGVVSSNKGDTKMFILYRHSYASSVHITNPNNLEEIVKVITYINKHK